ncbi:MULTISPECIES: toprim domain-containing protein [Flavonifractor]|uniref:Toprim domain-containing protein n=3 Tax=Flavonifractor plautii TaxID=292800 RepID=A0AAW6C0T4_FLAPL|nr:toprim domain-containing protein [Flavonifractor plautii]MCQ4720259.1 toprim domain-containing protein [Flavonifractor plautii]MDB7865812.1 toprim domain-containing protein [Flavonifractor plautii]MDB7871462.1 toprim domain-containing protein [Flavonifractor plautii]MDB7877917.1 toprim domain-containing protein [Flavonifractor plautii]MDB7885660.1 toprim domain-containing protein [Flavonifractor plautii]
MAGAQLCSPVRHWRPGRVLDAGAAPQPPIRCALPVDHDEPGQTAARRLQEELQGAGYHSGILLPVHKDWNDDLVQGQTMAGLVMTMGQSM